MSDESDNDTQSELPNELENESSQIIAYIHKAAQIILQSRQILNQNIECKTADQEDNCHDSEDSKDSDDSFELNVSYCSALKEEMNCKYLEHWNPYQSSLTFTIDITLETESNSSDLTSQSQLMEQWKIVFNYGAIDPVDTKDTTAPTETQMSLQLRSLLSYIHILPLQNLLPPLTIINPMDLFNLGVDVESDQDLAETNDDTLNHIPYKLSYRLSSAYAGEKKKTHQSSHEQGSDGHLRFDDYNDVNYYLFPLLEFGDIGSLQLSVFYINNQTFHDKCIENNALLKQFVSAVNHKKRLNNKYLEIKVKEFIEEKQQQQIVLNAIAEATKNIDANDAEEALYVDEDDYENDVVTNAQQDLPKVTVINKEKEQSTNADEQSDTKSSTMGYIKSGLTKIMDIKSGITKMKINIPRPCNLCVHILTHDTVTIGWKSDKALKDYDSATNSDTQKFRFEIRSREVNKDDHSIRETTTFTESTTYRHLEGGQMYKFQVRIIECLNERFVSKWSATLSVVIPKNDYDGAEKAKQKQWIESLKLEEIQSVCLGLLQKVSRQEQQLKSVQRALRIKHNQYNELNTKEHSEYRTQVPNLCSLLKEWKDLKLDVHLKLCTVLCEELMGSNHEPEKTAFHVLFDIVMHCYKEMMEQQSKKDANHILCNLDICLGDADCTFAHNLIDSIVHGVLRDKESKWSASNLLTEKETQFVVTDYIGECCRIIWCLLVLSSKDRCKYTLYPTRFDSHEQAMSKMDIYDEKIHKMEKTSTNHKGNIEYCSWPSIVKTNSDNTKEQNEELQILSPAFVLCS